jgi:hypothetical protein
VNASNSAGVAPLDGGTVFQLSVTYGGGLKLRVTRLLELQAEYGENYAKDPDFGNKQSVNLSQGIYSAQDPGTRRYSSYLLSLSFIVVARLALCIEFRKIRATGALQQLALATAPFRSVGACSRFSSLLISCI